MPKNVTIANFMHPVSEFWLIPCCMVLFCQLSMIISIDLITFDKDFLISYRHRWVSLHLQISL